MKRKGRSSALLTGVAIIVALAVVGWVNRAESRAWYLLWRDFESLGLNAQGYPEYRHRETEIIFVRLPGGEFWMGTSEEERMRLFRFPRLAAVLSFNQGFETYTRLVACEQPRHKVTLSPFLIAKYELTQAQWERVMGLHPLKSKDDNFPVEQVSWEGCQQFNRKTGLKLPTEARWEYACRGGRTEEAVVRFEALQDMEWYQDNSGGRAHLVGVKAPNGFGLYDMCLPLR